MTITNLGSHLWSVDCLRGAGVEPPAGWLELRTRYYALQSRAQDHTKCQDRLIAAILSGGDVDVDVLWSCANAERWPPHGDVVLSNVANAVYAELSRLYQPVARLNYATLAARFDEAATKFADAAKLVDVAGSADQAIENADRKVQQAWRDAPALGAALDELIEPLAVAASLAGAPGDIADPTFDNPQIQIPLTIANVGRLHRRRLFEGWSSTSRAGRWPALVALGAEIKAHAKPGNVELCDPPRPVHVEWVPRERGGHDQVLVDPEDSPENQPKGARRWSA